MELTKKEKIKALKILLREFKTCKIRQIEGNYPGLCAAIWRLNDGFSISYDDFAYLNAVIQANRPKRMRLIDRFRKGRFWEYGYFWPVEIKGPRIRFLRKLIIKEMLNGK